MTKKTARDVFQAYVLIVLPKHCLAFQFLSIQVEEVVAAVVAVEEEEGVFLENLRGASVRMV